MGVRALSALPLAAAFAAACAGAAAGDKLPASAPASASSEEPPQPRGGLGLAGTPRNEDAEATSKLSQAIAGSKLSLAQGLKLAEKHGHPIGGEFLLEGGKLELWIYTMKNDEFFEVSLDPERGVVLEATRVTSDGSREKLPKPGKAMAGLNVSLTAVVERAAAKNAGFQPLSAFLVADAAHPTVTINLLDGARSKFVTESVR